MILGTTMLRAQSCNDFVTAAYVEVDNVCQIQLASMDPVLANVAAGQVNEIVKQAAKEYEMVRLQRFLGRRSRDTGIGAQLILK